MTTFTVWKYDDPQGAEHAFRAIRYAADDNLVEVVDHATVSWPAGAAEPDTHHAHDSNRQGVGWGAFWGFVFGSLFFMPVVGSAVGAGIGGLTKASEGTGISQEQMDRLRAEIIPGTSALFLVTEYGDLDRLAERLHGMGSRLISTNLTDAERDELLEAFGDHRTA
ncbi:membrane protein [Actinoplanes sp. SE50]|uniref:DUF1269 domain-containing protein n=1 Tax=unclassified Actinoplanes TaxID=2626549 RepID=UPI00023ECEAD|nr:MULTISPECIES: DUF1269 domain-containing protein [unclassified Actinoplanes]AEV84877.1 hypothetical protein ACPL_3982 [Actinoplanes sp. SE50/110]ATO83268.1 membrane protein [Actinoplanes sp. SE50]SLM00675.1 membrane protein [Actinoplanes sp. SE50/110]